MDARAAPDVLSFARVRNDASAAPFLRYGGDGSVSLGGGATLRGQTFSFHDVFEGSARGTQAAVFEAVGASAVRRMAGGENVALVAQGQALSGKRWTLLGDLDAEANHGLVPRAIARVFALAARPDGGGLEAECEVRLSWVEVCQERLFDLLRPGSDELQLGESAARGAHAEGLAEPSVDSVEKALGLLRTGVTCGRHGMSHTVLTVLLRQRRQDGSTRVSTLTAVECAPPGVQQAQQASAALAEVVRSGGDAAAHRGSKLTRLLEKPGVLGGNCATSFFACCSPAKEHKEATAAAFKFAAEAMTLPNSARVNDFGIVEELAEHAACLTADEAALRQHARNLEDILAQLGIKAGGLASGKSFSKFSSLKRVAELDFRAADKQAEKTAVSRFDPQQVLRLSSECERLLHAKQQGEADLGNLESELAAAKSTAAGLMMDTVELREAIDRQRQAAPPLIEELRELRALHGASSEPGAGGVAQHGNIELLQLEAQAAELRRRAKATRTALAAAKAREHELAPKLVPPAGADRIYRPVDVSAQPPSAAAVAAAQEAARQQLRLVAPPASTSSAASGQGGSDDAGFTFELLEATFGCRQPEVQAASPPVAPEGMTQTDGTVLETIDVRDADFIRSEIEASNEDLRLVQGGMEISPEWRTVLASESLAYGSMVNIVAAGVPHHVRGAYWIKILETCGCPPPASLDRYVELASAPPSAEAAGGWRDDSPLAVVDRMFGSDRMADRQNRALHRVLRSYAQIDPTLKYCEAIGLVAGLCLKILPEYQAFRLLSALLLGEGRGDEPYLGPPGAARSPGLGLRGLYAEGFPLLECLQRQFNTLLRRLAGGLVLAYEGKQFNLKQLCAPWLFTLFTSSFPAKVGMRIWDHLVLQLLPQFGSADRTTPSCAVLSIACVALIKQHREELMRWDVGSASEFHNEIGMLLAERAMADAYFGQHLIPLAQDRQTTDSLRAEKSSFDKECQASAAQLRQSMTSTPAVPAAAVQEELRIDAEDGEAYSREEFIEAYGGTDEWDASEPAPQPGGSSVRSRSSSHSPSRDLGNRRTVVLERVVRSGHERDSKKVGRLKAGTVIEILETRKDPDGKQRVRFDQGAGGLAGWVSSSASGEGLAFEEEIYAALEHNLSVWLATAPSDGEPRQYEMKDLLRFAKTWKLEKAPVAEIYAKYVEHNAEDTAGWVAPPPGQSGFDISKYKSKGMRSKLSGSLGRMKSRGKSQAAESGEPGQGQGAAGAAHGADLDSLGLGALGGHLAGRR